MGRFYRSVWISDVHLSVHDARADLVYSFLNRIKCDHLYLVGDLIDVWSLRNRWHWPREYNEVIHKLLKRSRKGAHVVYIPGNHDEFFRNFVGYRFGDVEIRANAIHTTADGRRFLVLHGDEFDIIVRYRRTLSLLANWAYGRLLTLNRMVNAVRRFFGWPYWSMSTAIARKVQHAVKHLADFEELLVAEARRQRVDGVICGHTHRPALRDHDGVWYCNTGDWLENCTALVEHEDGRMELLWWKEELAAATEQVDPQDAAPTLTAAQRPVRRFWTRRPAAARQPVNLPID